MTRIILLVVVFLVSVCPSFAQSAQAPPPAPAAEPDYPIVRLGVLSYVQYDDELKHILEEHAQWLASEEKEGKRAEVRQARINSPYLPNAKLAKADFSGTDFGIEAYLGNADLGGAELQETSFQHAEFEELVRYLVEN
jgi:hypothetical protein